MTTLKIACIWTGNTLGFTNPHDGEQYVVPNTHANYSAIKEAVKANDAPTAVNLFNLTETVATQLELAAEVGDVKVSGGVVTFKGLTIQNSVVELILANLKEGFDITRYANFLTNLLSNPSFSSREQLHGFIEKYLFDITEDGRFYAYKVINDNDTDCHTGSIDNSKGMVVTMPREDVDENPNKTCSSGLHVCGRSYVKSFMSVGRKLVMVAVNPRDVVAIPTDYNDAKMRVCEYEVMGEVNNMFQASETGEQRGRVVTQGRDPKTGRFLSKMAFEPMPSQELDRSW